MLICFLDILIYFLDLFGSQGMEPKMEHHRNDLIFPGTHQHQL